MANFNMATLPLILALCAVFASALNFPLNVDCGSSDNPQGTLNMAWVGDDQYIRSGENRNIFYWSEREDLIEPLITLRCFPLRKKNCYSFKGVGQGKKILVRALFYYGNYDQKKSPPTFDLFFNGNLWTTVSVSSTRQSRFDVIHVTKVDDISVCLVRTNPENVPFIYSIEIKLLNDSIYKGCGRQIPSLPSGQISGIQMIATIAFDRLWQPFTDYEYWSLTNLTGSSDNIDVETAPDKPPVAVVRQAVTTSSSEAWNLTIPTLFNLTMQPTPYYVNFYFSEVWPNASRSFDIFLGDEKYINETISVPHGSVKEISMYAVNLSASSSITLVKTASSTHPPLINAAEFFRIGEEWSDSISTDASDVVFIVKALNELQKRYEQLYEWSGDPCLPSGYGWEWVGCNNEPSPQVTTLNLSGGGLTGFLFDFSNLTFLETIDLHNNSLDGSIPEFLGNFPKLKQLNLADNEFTGSLPKSLIDRKINLNISGNNVSGSSQKKTNTGVVAGATISVLLFLCLLVISITLALFIFKRRPSGKRSSTLLESEIKHDFSHAEIVDITNNFEKVLGEGGSGKVYYGKLRDGCEVAVKLLKDSLIRGTKEFVSEAKLLMTVLVSFVGYCEEGGKLILLYEYMSGGNLRQLLSGRNSEFAFLTWKTRLQIALRVATGLDYLHSVPAHICVSTACPNIMNWRSTYIPFTTKKGDITRLSTAVTGTLGYIDSEYYRTSMVTKKSDVYSFGVVLFELITGYPPIFIIAEEHFHIVQWVTPRLASGDIHGVADPKLRRQYNVNSISKVADIAMSCVSHPSHSRPNMSNVINQLKEAIEEENSCEYKGTNTPFTEVQLASSSCETSISFPSAR